MKPNLSAAQAAQQSNRDTGGKYATKVHGEQDSFTAPATPSGVEVKRWDDGHVEHYLDGEFHRVDGPAFVHYRDDGQDSPLRVEEFWQLGKRHRLDGPALAKIFESDIGYGVYDDPWVEENEFWVDGVQVDGAGFEEAAAAFLVAHPDGLVAASSSDAAAVVSWPLPGDTARCVREGEHLLAQRHRRDKCPAGDGDQSDYEELYGIEGANQFKAVYPILEHLQGNGCDTGQAEARRTKTGGWEVWEYSNEQADHDDPHGWVEAGGDITAYLTETPDGHMFDVSKAGREWQEIDDDTSISALLDLADN